MTDSTHSRLARVRSRIARALARLRQDRRGASFVEYIIVVGLVAIIAIAAFQSFGETVVNKLHEETNGLNNIVLDGKK
jgi:Flp pilus assembly pilin Flp